MPEGSSPDLWTTAGLAQCLIRIGDILAACDMRADRLEIPFRPVSPARSRRFHQQPGEMKMMLEPQSLIVWLVIGLIAGWLAGQIVKGYGFGLVGNLVIGVVGAFIGGWLLGLLNIHIGGGNLSPNIKPNTCPVVGPIIIWFF